MNFNISFEILVREIVVKSPYRPCRRALVARAPLRHPPQRALAHASCGTPCGAPCHMPYGLPLEFWQDNSRDSGFRSRCVVHLFLPVSTTNSISDHARHPGDVDLKPRDRIYSRVGRLMQRFERQASKQASPRVSTHRKAAVPAHTVMDPSEGKRRQTSKHVDVSKT